MQRWLHTGNSWGGSIVWKKWRLTAETVCEPCLPTQVGCHTTCGVFRMLSTCPGWYNCRKEKKKEVVYSVCTLAPRRSKTEEKLEIIGGSACDQRWPRFWCPQQLSPLWLDILQRGRKGKRKGELWPLINCRRANDQLATRTSPSWCANMILQIRAKWTRTHSRLASGKLLYL